MDAKVSDLKTNSIGLNRQEEALVIAERGRNRAFVDLLMEKQGLGETHTKTKMNSSRIEDPGPNSLDQIKEFVNRQRASVLYYSIAAGFLYAWLIVPTKGNNFITPEGLILNMFLSRGDQIPFDTFE